MSSGWTGVLPWGARLSTRRRASRSTAEGLSLDRSSGCGYVEDKLMFFKARRLFFFSRPATEGFFEEALNRRAAEEPRQLAPAEWAYAAVGSSLL
jgi:hypothetical protein